MQWTLLRRGNTHHILGTLWGRRDSKINKTYCFHESEPPRRDKTCQQLHCILGTSAEEKRKNRSIRVAKEELINCLARGAGWQKSSIRWSHLNGMRSQINRPSGFRLLLLDGINDSPTTLTKLTRFSPEKPCSIHYVCCFIRSWHWSLYNALYLLHRSYLTHQTVSCVETTSYHCASNACHRLGTQWIFLNLKVRFYAPREHRWSSWGSSWTRCWTQVSRIAGRFFTIWATREVQII